MYQNVGISGDHSGDSLFYSSRVGMPGGGGSQPGGAGRCIYIGWGQKKYIFDVQYLVPQG